jgi:Spy/CpxP family protein refolding chaperone
MKYAKLLLLLIVAVVAMSVSASGQNGPPPDDQPPGDRPDERRPNLLAELGLSQEQVQQIRRMNQERRPLMQRAQRRLREANRDLDMAIYADNFSEADFQARLKEFQAAQSEMAQLRFEGEMSVRKVLTAEQIVKFRQLRAEFAPRRRDRQDRRDQRRDGRGLAPRQGVPPPTRSPIQ